LISEFIHIFVFGTNEGIVTMFGSNPLLPFSPISRWSMTSRMFSVRTCNPGMECQMSYSHWWLWGSSKRKVPVVLQGNCFGFHPNAPGTSW
jgi:hypothetical protein